jgi:CheY-specific phosphatase CheX
LKAEHADAFVASAFEVLGNQAEARPERGSPVLRSGGAFSARELTALVALSGDLEGVTFYSMSLATATKLAAVIGKNELSGGGQLDGDAITELARLVSVGAAALLEQRQCKCVAEAPRLVTGFGEPLTAMSPVLIVPLFTEYGDIDIGIALTPGACKAEVPSAELFSVAAADDAEDTEPEQALTADDADNTEPEQEAAAAT